MVDLKDILSGKKEEPKEYYWALTIEPGWIQAGVWRIEEEKTQVISTSPPTPWELEEELSSAVDTALSASVQDFPEDINEPSKTVFGVISSWVGEGQIKEEYLEKIKKICSELSLTPVGFVVLPEAVAHLIKSEEGSSLSAVVLGLSKDTLEISVFKLGKLMGTSQVARSLSLIDDVVEGLTRFTQGEALPSRFLLYDGKEGEIEEARQALLKANWDDLGKVKFLHTPKIETINAERKVHAVALAGASELAEASLLQVAKKGEEEKEEKVVDKTQTAEKEVPEVESVSPQSLGFAVGEDIVAAKIQAKLPVQPEEIVAAQKEEEVPRKEVADVAAGPEETKEPKFLKSIFKNVKDKASTIFGGTMKPKRGAKLSRKTLVFGGLFFLIIVISGFALWWFYPKATVTIYVSPKKLDERANLTVDPSAQSIDPGQGILPGEASKIVVNGERTKSTTGTKTVGEKATGEATLYRAGSELTLAAGAKLFGPGNLNFTLDESTTVASGSAGNPGTTKAKVTAVDIGAQYNLAGGTAFSISNYPTSDIEAKNESSFSGGSSREISAVSEEDQQVLEEELTEELQDQAKEKLLERMSADKAFIEESLSSTPSSRTFSNKVGDEASNLKLSLSLDVQALVVDKEALISLAVDILKDKIPEGFVLRDDQIDLDFEFKGEVEGKFELTSSVKANLLPAIDPAEVKRKIVGKYPPLMEDYFINEIPGFIRAEIGFNKPRFPGRLGTLPHKLSNLEVIIAAEK